MARDGFIIDDPSDAPQRRPLSHRLVLLAVVATCGLLVAIAFLAEESMFDRLEKATGQLTEQIGMVLPNPVESVPVAHSIDPPPPVEIIPQGAGVSAAASPGD